MLIKLTSKCSMMCPHCMEYDAKLSDRMMKAKDFPMTD